MIIYYGISKYKRFHIRLLSEKSQYVLFFDDGGVINNNHNRGKKWKKLIADYFISRYGGEPNEWAEANHLALQKEIKQYESQISNNPNGNYKNFRDQADIVWIKPCLTL